MDDAINLIDALRADLARLRRVLAMNMNVGDTYPGEPQVETINSLIEELDELVKRDSASPVTRTS